MYATQNYGCRVTTITISQRQFDYLKKRVESENLSHRLEVKLIDYRNMTGRFDKIVSIEMIEAVGHEFLPVFFGQCQRLLKKDGLLVLQMILSPDHRYQSFRKNVDWIQKHIFPGSLLPSYEAIHQAIRATGTLGLLDYEDMTQHYVRTLALWRTNFNANVEKVRRLRFSEHFVRKWNYYFSYCEAAFKMRNINVAQAVFTRPNNLAI